MTFARTTIKLSYFDHSVCMQASLVSVLCIGSVATAGLVVNVL